MSAQFRIQNVFTPSEEEAKRLYELIMSTTVYDPQKVIENIRKKSKSKADHSPHQ